MRTTPVIFLVWFVSACADVPQLNTPLDPAIAKRPYPQFLQPSQLRSVGVGSAPISKTETDVRLARLNARAVRLRRTVINDQDQNRLSGGISR